MKWNDRHKTMLANFLGRRERGSFSIATMEYPSEPTQSADTPETLISERMNSSDQKIKVLPFDRKRDNPPHLKSILKQSPGIPAHNAILGVCEDTLPVLLDLKEQTIRSILAVAENPQTSFNLLTCLAFSSAALNPARNLQVIVISSRADDWREHPAMQWAGRSFLNIYSVYSRESEIAILQAAEWARDCQLGQRRGAQVLLILDNLAACAEMDFDARLNLEWLLREGSPLGINPVAVVTGNDVLDVSTWIRSFSIVLMGEIPDRRPYYTLNLLDAGEEFPVLEPDGFASRIENGWFVFHTVNTD